MHISKKSSNFARKIGLMSTRTYISQLSPVLFWDVDREHMDTEQHSAGLIQRVLEHGTLQDTIRRIASAESGDTPIRRLTTAELDSETVVKYATGGLDPNLFVQKYHIKLPSEAELKAFIAKSIRGTE